MSNPHKGRTGLNRVIHATGYSLQGLLAAYKHESAFRQEVWLAIPMVPAAIHLGQNWTETCLLLGTLMLVMVTELLNSAIEATVDRISFDLHELSKRAKDLGSAAVLLSLVLCIGVWGAALVHYWNTLQ